MPTKLRPLALLFSLLLVSFQQSLSQSNSWAVQLGGNSWDEPRAVATDAAGNIYVTGVFEGTADFDPTDGVYNLSSIGNSNDVFITKLSSSGNMLWTKQIGGAGDDYAFSIAVDDTENIYTSGMFSATSDFDPGPGTHNLTSNGGEDIVVTKLDADGNFVWAKSIGGIGDDYSFAIAVDKNGNVYGGGYFNFSVDFDPGPNNFTLTATTSSSFFGDAFVFKLDPAGNFLWAKQMGGNDNDEVFSISTDNSLNVYLTGIFSSTADFDPGPDTNNLTSKGGYDIFICKLDVNGNLVWANQYGGPSNDFGRSITNDGTGNNYAVGTFQDTVPFEPGVQSNTLTSAGSDEIFILSTDSNGNIKWAKQLGGSDQDEAGGIVLDKSRETLFVTGNSINPSWAFLTTLDTHGNISSTKQYGYGANSYGITIDPSGNPITTGFFGGTVDFDMGTQHQSLTSFGYADAYVYKVELNCSITSQQNVTACDTYTWIDGKIYTASTNVPTFNLKSKAGCDSVVTLHLTINKSKAVTDIVSASDSYTWIDGKTYTASTDVPTFNLTTKAGCDSVVTLHLTINKSAISTDTVSVCEAYRWIDGITYTISTNSPTFILKSKAGSDSVIALHLTINKSTSVIDSVSSCSSYKWIDGNTYTTSTNTPTFNLKTKAGCDSVVSLHLSITKVDTVVTRSGQAFISSAANARYKWLECDSHAYVDDATGQTFTPKSSGSYAVEVTENGCTASSRCLSNVVASIEKNARDIQVYPNPFKETFTVAIPAHAAGSKISVSDLRGQIVPHREVSTGDALTLIVEGSPNLYFITVTTPTGDQYHIKIVKE